MVSHIRIDGHSPAFSSCLTPATSTPHQQKETLKQQPHKTKPHEMRGEKGEKAMNGV